MSIFSLDKTPNVPENSPARSKNPVTANDLRSAYPRIRTYSILHARQSSQKRENSGSGGPCPLDYRCDQNDMESVIKSISKERT